MNLNKRLNMNQIALQERAPAPLDLMLSELQSTQKMCEALMQTPHYKKLGSEGIFAIVQKARTLNVNALDALNGALYYVNGKVEMSSNMMMQLIRQAGHSVTKDSRSDDSVCILHGKRKDNGDTWSESFSIADAKRAGIYKNVWEKYPRNLMFARALSNLARQLFPDVIKGCYIEGEISSSSLTHCASSSIQQDFQVMEAKPEKSLISESQYLELESLIGPDQEYRSDVLNVISKKHGATSLRELPLELFDRVRKTAIERLEDKMKEATVSAADEEIEGE
jgi:hypothetical protein